MIDMARYFDPGVMEDFGATRRGGAIGAFAAIGQAEGFLIGAGNDLALVTDGAAENVNVVIVENRQDASSPGGRVTALQSETGSLVQGTSAVGTGGIFQAVQAT